jgi:CRP-like cAMP-binding protein
MVKTMTTEEVLGKIGSFTTLEVTLFEQNSTRKSLNRGDLLLREDEVCKSIYFILSGSFYQFQASEKGEIILDLHLEGEWMFNQQSLADQIPSTAAIKAFSDAEVLELSLENFHRLIAKSQSFLQFGKILTQAKATSFIYDNSLTPAERYDFITNAKPLLVKVFPVKMIASYLKIAPETLSRVRASC